MPEPAPEPQSADRSHPILGKSDMADEVRLFDWSRTPLGPIAEWSRSLLTVVNILLSSRYAMWMAWGPELTFICNDAYRPTLGIKRNWALGARADQVWAEIWPDIGPRIESVVTSGQATYDEGLLLILERSGFPEETYHTFSYSPLSDDQGRISGMLCVVTEDTDRLIGDRRLQTLSDVASALSGTKTQEEVLRALSDRLEGNPRDLPFTLTYLFDEDGDAQLGCTSGIRADHPLAPADIERGGNFPWPAAEIYAHPGLPVRHDLVGLRHVAELPGGYWNKPAEVAAVVAIRQQGLETPAGFLIAAINPYRRYEASYRGFIDLLAGQIGAALANARAYEAERRRAEALAEIDRAKTAFFSNVSHEFRTPLTLILGPLEEALRQQTNPPYRDQLEVAYRNSLRLLKLVNTLLDFSRIEAGRMQANYEPVDLAALTAEIASNFKSATAQAGLELVVDCHPLPEPVYVDRDMWEKIVLNLISNAFKFTLAGSIRVSLSVRDSLAHLAVSDTGTGIPVEELPRLFERFHRVEGSRGRSHEGSGIGLALVLELVKAHGGTVSVESELGRGSTFIVGVPFGSRHLPADRIHAAASRPSGAIRADAYVQEALRWLPSGAPAMPSTPSAAEQDETELPDPPIGVAGEPLSRVLLAEDNADMRDYVRRLLSPHMEVIAVDNGQEALSHALHHPPDLVLSDVMMPVMDGFTLLKALRSHPGTSTIPVILLSARAGEESRLEGAEAGADDYLVKPFSARELFARVRAHLKIARLRAETLESLRKERSELDRRVAEFETLFRELPVGVAVASDAACDHVRANPALARLLGISPDENASVTRPGEQPVPFRLYRDGLEIPGRDLPMQKAARCGEEVRDFECEIVRSDGTRLIEYGHAVPLLASDGRVTGSLGVFLDVTERRRAEETLRRTNEELRRANEDLNQFAYSASHDLQEPLRNVSIYSQLLQKKLEALADGEIQEFLRCTIEGASRMETLLRDLLAYNQVSSQTLPLQWTDANIALRHTLDILQRAATEVHAEILADELPSLPVNETHLQQLFQNLIGNAIKYRDAARAPRIRVRAERQGAQWRFSVSDNGIGIAPEYHQRVFGIFKRLHSSDQYSGTGIGLAIAQRIVERYGGKIWLASEPDKGSTFFFTLPDGD